MESGDGIGYVSEEYEGQLGKILCCQCSTAIDPNPTNMCVACLRTQVDITEGIPKQVVIYFCKGCERYLQPPEHWVECALESKELLTLCMKKLRGLSQVRLIDTSFVWTEPHSRRIKISLTVQKEVMGGAILQQVFIVEYVVNTQMCPDCHRTEGKNFWRAVVQVRQRVQHKKTFLYLEQLILKHRAQANCLNIKACHEGVDFYFAKKDGARKLVDFISTVLPCRCQTSQQLITHDTHNNTYTYKYTFCVEIVPVCKNDVVCLPINVARSFGSIGQVCICFRVTNSIYIIDPSSLQVAEVTSQQYWRFPFQTIGSRKQLTEYVVMDIDHVLDSDRVSFSGQGPVSLKHVLTDVWVVRASELGLNDSQIHCRSHMGHLLKPGDLVLGMDLANLNANNAQFNKIKQDRLPDVVLIKKIYGDRKTRHRRRNWKLKHLELESEIGSNSERDYQDFLEDLEEDPTYRQAVNIFKDANKIAVDCDDKDDDFPHITLQDMLDELTLEEDATGEEGGPMLE